MIYQRTNGTYFYECDTCWWVSPDYPHKHTAQNQSTNCECEITDHETHQ